MIFISGTTLSLFLSLLVLFKIKKNRADYILMIWFIVIGIHLLLFYLDISGYSKTHTNLLGVIMPFPFIRGPLLFLYVSALVNPVSKKKIFDGIHSLPFVLCFVYLIKFFGFPPERKLYIMEHKGIGFETFVTVKFFAIIIFGLGYIIWSLILINKHKQNIRNKFSNLEKINLQWLQYLTYGLGIIWLVIIFDNEIYTFISVLIFIVIIGFFGIRQVGIFTNNQFAELPQYQKDNIGDGLSTHENIENNFVQYEKSGLTQEKKQILGIELENLMVEKKVFLNPELSLDLLAAQLSIHSNYLSQYINEELGVSFYDYVNKYRVMEFEKLAANPENHKFTILALAYDCGFNSKSTFNRYFKKVTGLSPSTYLSNQQLESAQN